MIYIPHEFDGSVCPVIFDEKRMLFFSSEGLRVFTAIVQARLNLEFALVDACAMFNGELAECCVWPDDLPLNRKND